LAGDPKATLTRLGTRFLASNLVLYMYGRRVGVS